MDFDFTIKMLTLVTEIRARQRTAQTLAEAHLESARRQSDHIVKAEQLTFASEQLGRAVAYDKTLQVIRETFA